MAGHVRERSPGRWELRVYAGVDALTGRRRYATRTVEATSERAARRKLAAFVAEVDTTQMRAGDATFGQVLDEWIDTKGDAWSPSTLKEHRGIAGRYLEPLRRVPVHQLRTVDLDRFYRRLREQGGRDGAPLDPATVRRAHVVVRAALEQAVRWELIARNPAHHADPGTADEAEVTPPTVADLAALLKAAEGDDGEGSDLAAYIVVAAVTGARRGALCALRWTDLDLELGVIRFPRVISEGPDGPVERTASRSKRSSRLAALDPVTTAVLASHRVTLEARAAELGVELAADAFVFTDDPQGLAPWRPDSTSRRYAKARAEAGLPSTLRLHDLRHFMATLALAGGIDVRTVASRGGWAQAATLLDRYAHVLEPVDRRAAAILGAAVHGDRES